MRRERGEPCRATAGRERAVPPSLELERARRRREGRLAGHEPVAGRERSLRLHRGDRYLDEDSAELARAADDGRGGGKRAFASASREMAFAAREAHTLRCGCDPAQPLDVVAGERTLYLQARREANGPGTGRLPQALDRANCAGQLGGESRVGPVVLRLLDAPGERDRDDDREQRGGEKNRDEDPVPQSHRGRLSPCRHD